MPRWIVSGVVIVAVCIGVGVALLVVQRDGSSPDERFAENICSTTLPWARRMRRIFDDSVHTRAAPGHDAGWLRLYGLAYRGMETTRKYGVRIRAVPVPETEAGRKAAKFMDVYSRRPFGWMAEEERRVRKLPRDITLLQSIRGLNHMELTLSLALAEMGDALVLYVPELVDDFQKADSCKKLRVLMTRPVT